MTMMLTLDVTKMRETRTNLKWTSKPKKCGGRGSSAEAVPLTEDGHRHEDALSRWRGPSGICTSCRTKDTADLCKTNCFIHIHETEISFSGTITTTRGQGRTSESDISAKSVHYCGLEESVRLGLASLGIANDKIQFPAKM